jgi:hypothetical protein
LLACANIPHVVKNCSFLIIILLICGCASSKKIIVSDSLDATPVITGSVVNAPALQKGGTVMLGAFSPGPGAAANDDTDELSSMMMKGIKDALPQENTHFIISTDAQKEPDYLLEGSIDEYGHDVHVPHLKLHKNQNFLSVTGDLWFQNTGEKVLLFQTSIVIDPKTQNSNTAAYQIGVAIAHFIGLHST